MQCNYLIHFLNFICYLHVFASIRFYTYKGLCSKQSELKTHIKLTKFLNFKFKITTIAITSHHIKTKWNWAHHINSKVCSWYKFASFGGPCLQNWYLLEYINPKAARRAVRSIRHWTKPVIKDVDFWSSEDYLTLYLP